MKIAPNVKPAPTVEIATTAAKNALNHSAVRAGSLNFSFEVSEFPPEGLEVGGYWTVDWLIERQGTRKNKTRFVTYVELNFCKLLKEF